MRSDCAVRGYKRRAGKLRSEVASSGLERWYGSMSLKSGGFADVRINMSRCYDEKL